MTKNHQTTIIASAAVAALMTAGCSAQSDADPDESPTSAETDSAGHAEVAPPAKDSLSELGPEVREAVESGADLGTFDNAEEFRRAVAGHYVDSRLGGDDPVVAEAKLADLFTDDGLDRAAQRWSQQSRFEPSDFVYIHQDSMDVSTVEYRHGEVDGSQTVYIDWTGTLCQEDDHSAIINVEVEEEAGEYRISDIQHFTGCTCGQCVA